MKLCYYNFGKFRKIDVVFNLLTINNLEKS